MTQMQALTPSDCWRRVAGHPAVRARQPIWL